MLSVRNLYRIERLYRVLQLCEIIFEYITLYRIYNHFISNVIEIILLMHYDDNTIKKKNQYFWGLSFLLKFSKCALQMHFFLNKVLETIIKKIEWKLFFNHHSENAVYSHCLHVSYTWNESSRNKAKSTSCLRSMNVQKQTWPANQTY